MVNTDIKISLEKKGRDAVHRSSGHVTLLRIAKRAALIGPLFST
jgi:hypothetical protein